MSQTVIECYLIREVQCQAVILKSDKKKLNSQVKKKKRFLSKFTRDIKLLNIFFLLLNSCG